MQVTRRWRCWLAVAVLSLGVAAVRAEEKPSAEKGDKAGQELREYLEKFHDAIQTGSDEEIKEAVDRYVPSKAQVAALFPNDSEKVWSRISQVRDKFTTRYKEFAADVRKRGKPESIETIDVRKSDSSRRFNEVLAIIPEDVPVFRVDRALRQEIEDQLCRLQQLSENRRSMVLVSRPGKRSEAH